MREARNKPRAPRAVAIGKVQEIDSSLTRTAKRIKLNDCTNAAASWAALATFDKPIGAISTSESMLLVAAGDKILISKDLGKSFK